MNGVIGIDTTEGKGQPPTSAEAPKARRGSKTATGRGGRLRRFGSHLNFIYRRNRTRILVVLGIVTLLVIFNGARGLVQAAFGMVAALPLLALQIAFGLSYIVAYFGFMFWFLSRPRSYVTTPDDPQVGLSFEEYRGQPDLLDHAKSTVKILRGEERLARSRPARQEHALGHLTARRRECVLPPKDLHRALRVIEQVRLASIFLE